MHRNHPLLGKLKLPCIIMLLTGASLSVSAADTHDQRGIDEFNTAMTVATRKLDNAGVLALWEDDGISLLPSTPPLRGKKAIAKMFDDVTSQTPHAVMKQFDFACYDVSVSGDWASEWCTEHQIVEMGNGKPPFEGRGNMLLVLHRGGDGKWRLVREMWNQAEPEK